MSRILDVAGSISTAQITVTTSPARWITQQLARKSLILLTAAANNVFYGPAGMTAGTGALLPGLANASVDLFPFNGELWLCTAAGTELVYVTMLF